jgi:hypothetical protein
LKAVAGLAGLVLLAPCSQNGLGPEPVETLTAALALNQFPVSVRINQVTVGQAFDPEIEEFSLTNFSSEFFQCGPQSTLSNLSFCNRGQVYRLPDDLPNSSIKNTIDETVTVGVNAGQTTVTVPLTISERPFATFGSSPITINVNINLSTGAFTATQRFSSPIKQLTNTCVTNNLDWKFCWEVILPCSAGTTSLPCTTQSPTPGCPDVAGHGTCNGPIPGACVPDPAPPGSTCGVTSHPWDLTPNLPVGQTSFTDDNGLLLNPRWGWQVGTTAAADAAEARFLTSQPTTHQSSLTCDVGAFLGLASGGGHTNWKDATYTGPLRWDSHSPPGKDDDYNISIVPPIVVGTPFPAGITADNNQQTFIQSEFDSDETIDDFDSIDWWSRFHAAVDISNARAAAFIDGHQAIVTGRIGLDEAHDTRSEIHPVHIFAVRQTSAPVPADDAWSIFFRNSGNEGYCGPGQEYVNLTSMTLRLPRPTPAQGVPANADFTIGSATKFVGNFAPPSSTPVDFMKDPSTGDVLVKVTLQTPTAESFIVGEVHLVWSPTTTPTAPAPAPPPLLASDEDEGPEASWGAALAAMSPTQKNVFNSLLTGMAPRQPASITTLPVRKLTTTPPPPPITEPTVFSGGPSTRTASRSQARLMAACIATNGNIAGAPTLCNRPDVGTGRCLYASSALSVDDRVTVVNADGSPAAVANSGTGQTNIGADAKVGIVTSVGPVLLRSRSTTGTVTTNSTVSLQDGVTHGTITEHASIVLPGAGLNVAFPSSQGRPSISLEPGTPGSATPGVYTSVSVKTGATLSLAAGTYFFDSMMLEPTSTVSLDSQGAGVTIYVRNDLTVRGAIVDRLGGAPNLFIGVLGTAGATISAPFQGRVIAPNGPITLDTVGAPGYRGSFMGKSLTVHQSSRVVCAPF